MAEAKLKKQNFILMKDLPSGEIAVITAAHVDAGRLVQKSNREGFIILGGGFESERRSNGYDEDCSIPVQILKPGTEIVVV